MTQRHLIRVSILSLVLLGLCHNHPVGATTWEEFRASHRHGIHKGLDRPAPTENLSPAWMAAMEQWRADLRLRVARFYHRWQSLRAAEIAASPVPAPAGWGGGPVDWDAIAACESGGRWDLNTGNGYWGGLQFSPGTWYAAGGGPFDGTGPFPYSREEQIAVAETWVDMTGCVWCRSGWPGCGANA